MERSNIQPIVYYNNSCSKSKSALSILIEKGFEPITIDYINNPLEKSQLIEIINLLAIKPETLIRKKEPLFLKNYALKKLTQTGYLNALIKFPELIERPVVIFKGKGLIARPPEKVLELL